MRYKSFNQNQFNTFEQHMFLGENVNVSRYDRQRYPVFEQLIEKQLSFFWRPEEVDLSLDRGNFQALGEHEQHIFLSNLKYQTLLDSVQGRSPNMALLPLASLPEVETWIETWAFSETIHSRSYTHIIRNIVNEPGLIFDDIMANDAIASRAVALTDSYDKLILMSQIRSSHGYGVYQVDGEFIDVSEQSLMRQLYLTLASVNVLEAVRFYVSFACSFAFAERGTMEGNAKIIKLIARDEALHLTGTQHMLKLMASGQEGEAWASVAAQCKEEVVDLFRQAASQEKAWADHLFKDGSMIGLNRDILCQYVEYITDQNLQALDLPTIFNIRTNPLPWMDAWLESDSVQVAPQEAEISSYLVGAIDAEVNTAELEDFVL